MTITRRHFTLVETQDVLDSYKNGESATSIAKRMGRITKVIVGTLKRNGVAVDSERHVATQFTPEKLKEAQVLYSGGMGCQEIAERLDCSEMTVYNHLKASGQAMRARGGSRTTRETAAAMAEDYRTLSMHEVAAKHGVSTCTVHRVLHATGANIRGMGPAVEFKEGKIRCNDCGEFKELSEFPANPAHASGHNYHCKECARWAPREQRYGITRQQYDTMFKAQGGVCAGCKKPWVGTAGHPDLVVDHDHATGAVRCLLCPDCNQALGLLRDNAETMKNLAALVAPAAP